jgi:K+-sensing histidine kinase KdpD
VTDGDGLIQEVNVAAGRLLRRTSLAGKPLVLRVAASDRRRVHALAGDALAGVPTRPVVVTLVEGRLAELRAEVTVSAVGADRLMWLLRDVTAEENAALRLHEAVAAERRIIDHLRRIDEIRDTFVRSVSHDLQAPLIAVSGLAGLLVDRPRLTASDRQAMLRQIQATAATLLVQLRGLLDAERLSRGEIRLQCRPVAVDELVDEVADQVALGDRTLVVDVPASTVEVDPVVVERIVHNLLTNTVDHTPPGTTIWVRLRDEPDGVLLTVEDDGPGVPAAARSRVFELFHSEDRDQWASGFGVGLALVREFAVLHGGYARLEERPGGGACFQVLLGDDPG